jgi:D-alanine-D-alanine ligase
VKAMRALILHNQVTADSPKDELDVLVQAAEVEKALIELGYRTAVVPFSLDVDKAMRAIRKAGPLFVFNLVESVAGDGRLIHMAPALLDHLGLPFTGSGQEAIFVTSNKLLGKKLLQQAGVATPPWLAAASLAEGAAADWMGTYLLKSVWEHASNWLADDSIVHAADAGELQASLEKKNHDGNRFYAERYIEGREFNQAILAGELLPMSEIRFVEFPADKLRILDFRAKWEEDSFEYAHTRRSLDFPAADQPLLDEMRAVAGRCWQSLGLGGYARVDFRVDCDNRPWVLEINTNPCLSPDSGFFAAAGRAGLSFTALVKRIIDDCLERFGKADRRAED